MANTKAQQARENLHRAKKKRERKKALHASARRKPTVAVAKLVALLVTAALFLAFALLVGDSDYKPTLVGWVPFFAILMAVLLSAVYVVVLRATIEFSDETHLADCRRGHDVPFTVRLHNKGPLFFFRIEAYFYISDMFGNIASETMTTFSLAPFEETEVSFAAKFEHIGTYSAGLDRIVISDFLGLFSRELPNVRRSSVNVTPNLQLIDGIHFSNTAMLESTKAAKSVQADSMDYSHVRQYVPGDPLKTIHWKLSARTDGYMTRLYEKYTNPGVGIILDFFGPSNEAAELMGFFDAVVESGLSIGNYAQSRGMETEVFFRNRHGENRRVTAWNEDNMAQLIDEMPRMSNESGVDQDAFKILEDQFVSQYGQNNLVVCSANIDSQLVSAIVDAKVHRRHPLMIAVVPPELSGRALDAYCKPLAQLDSADIPYMIISRSDDLAGVS